MLLRIINGVLDFGRTTIRNLSVVAGDGTASATVGGVLTVNTTQAATIADTNETTLWSYVLPASTLNTDGKTVRITVFGSYGATGNTKTVRLKFGGTTIQTQSSTFNGLGWRITADVTRTSASAQLSNTLSVVANNSPGAVIGTPAETLANAVTIALTGQNGTAAANDVVFRGAMVEIVG